MKRILYPALVGLLALLACENKHVSPKEEVGELEMHVENVVGSSPLAYNTAYTTAAGDDFKVTELRYYVSNVQLVRADGSVWAEPESYYLIDQAKTASQHLAIEDVPVGDYTALRITIGVDVARNTAGAQTGALDPAHQMIWDWTTGYIFLRLNGSSSKAPGNGGLFFDVAGFRDPYNNIRTLTLPLPAGTAALHIREGGAPEMHLKANVLKLFDGPQPVRFAQLSTAAGGAESQRLADNLAAGMFRIDHIHGN
ncbi:MbnP family protein [Hymenobacter edaphi]|uniref:Copper-binding protein MbnP-like domain-containing protein n=1 Tax=Hymenobacter edaphi TaxID=2211146 RepID=A0A328BY15_9BACT|nr:MbnP family protein [Hymenobacter edaphi]RAK70008.1 hypothetical protein DLM85_03915 [Hymenobacter edaphi]